MTKKPRSRTPATSIELCLNEEQSCNRFLIHLPDNALHPNSNTAKSDLFQEFVDLGFSDSLPVKKNGVRQKYFSNIIIKTGYLFVSLYALKRIA